MRYLIDFSYSGALFNGYQKQPGLRCVQSEIEKVLTNINNGKEVIIYSAGRTDAKVNALHQIAHFDLNVKITPYKLKSALNSYLSDDIYINDAKEVDKNFHARHMVKSKRYEYKINVGEFNPLERFYVYQYCNNLNIEKMREAIKYLKGTHDFTTFTSAEDKRENKIRTINKASINKKANIITISFESKGFLKYQVRNMVGLLIKIGEEKIMCNDIPNMFDKKDRTKGSICAPPEGLTLVEIRY